MQLLKELPAMSELSKEYSPLAYELYEYFLFVVDICDPLGGKNLDFIDDITILC